MNYEVELHANAMSRGTSAPTATAANRRHAVAVNPALELVLRGGFRF